MLSMQSCQHQSDAATVRQCYTHQLLDSTSILNRLLFIEWQFSARLQSSFHFPCPLSVNFGTEMAQSGNTATHQRMLQGCSEGVEDEEDGEDQGLGGKNPPICLPSACNSPQTGQRCQFRTAALSKWRQYKSNKRQTISAAGASAAIFMLDTLPLPVVGFSGPFSPPLPPSHLHIHWLWSSFLIQLGNIQRWNGIVATAPAGGFWSVANLSLTLSLINSWLIESILSHSWFGNESRRPSELCIQPESFSLMPSMAEIFNCLPREHVGKRNWNKQSNPWNWNSIGREMRLPFAWRCGGGGRRWRHPPVALAADRPPPWIIQSNPFESPSKSNEIVIESARVGIGSTQTIQRKREEEANNNNKMEF